MRGYVYALVVASGVIAVPAIAQDSYPDIRGTWKGDVQAVSVDEGQPDARPTFGTYAAAIEIAEQQDRRFAGDFSFGKSDSRAIVGVFTEPDRILWSEPGGFAHGKVIDDNVIEVCYVRSTEFDQVASCERYQRQK